MTLAVDLFDEFLERGAEVAWELGGKVLLEWDDADEFENIKHVFATVDFLEPDGEFAPDEVGEPDDLDALDGADAPRRAAKGIVLDHVDGDAVDHVLAEKRRVAIRELLSTLPENQAETLALRVVLGMSLAEVATATNVPLNTVRSRIRLAREALMSKIEANPTLLELLDPS